MRPSISNRSTRDPTPCRRLAGELGLDQLLTFVQRHCAILHERNVNPAIIGTSCVLTLNGSGLASAATSDKSSPKTKRHNGISTAIGSRRSCTRRVHLDRSDALAGDLVINATVPPTRFTATRPVLLDNLLRRGRKAAV